MQCNLHEIFLNFLKILRADIEGNKILFKFSIILIQQLHRAEWSLMDCVGSGHAFSTVC